jgi:hypothetical protein
MDQRKLQQIKSGRSFLSAVAIAILAIFVVSGSILAQEETQVTSETEPKLLVKLLFAGVARRRGDAPGYDTQKFTFA